MQGSSFSLSIEGRYEWAVQFFQEASPQQDEGVNAKLWEACVFVDSGVISVIHGKETKNCMSSGIDADVCPVLVPEGDIRTPSKIRSVAFSTTQIWERIRAHI